MIFSSFLKKEKILIGVEFQNQCESPNIIRHSLTNIYSEAMKVCGETLQNGNMVRPGIPLEDYESFNVYHLFYDVDSVTYFKTFMRINEFNYKIKNKLIELKISKKYFKNLKKKTKDFIVEPYIFENILFTSFSDFDQFYYFVLAAKQSIKNRSTMDPYSAIYVKIFNDNTYIYHFVIFFNFLIFLLLSFLFYKITKTIFPSVSKILTLLIISNVMLFPLTSIYFLSFYKEPLILLSLISILYNFIYLLKKK